MLVDEYQDTNRLQSKILLRLKPDGRGMMVVGDDAQAIYSFRAATIRNILDFPDKFKPRARIITLEQNYRSTQPILDACNTVMGFAKERFTKNLRSDRRSKQKPFLTTVVDETAQARYVAQQILKAREAGVPLKLKPPCSGPRHHSAQLEIELARRNIPFVKYGGLSFWKPLTSKTYSACCAGAKTSGIELPDFGFCNCCQGLGRPRRPKSSMKSKVGPLSEGRAGIPFPRRQRRIGQPLPS